jgi:hypothetical protein
VLTLDKKSMNELNKRVSENTLLRIEVDILKDAIRNGKSITGVSAKALKLFGLI